jgi:hypothetical protein
MPVGVVTTTVPAVNDIVQGEFKAYYNYRQPTQLLIGATQGGAKLDINRVIDEIKFDGAYGPTLDSNGVPLVRTREIIGTITLESLYLKYYNRKIISDCESTGTWESLEWAGAAGGTYAAETSIVNSGDQSAKATIPLSTANAGIHEVFASSKDLTAFDNSETSVAGDYIGFAIYITTQDKADLGSADIRIAFHMDAELTETNLYYYDVAASALTADDWTTFKIAKSSFTQSGTGDWSAVTGVSFKVDAGTTAETVFYVDSIELIQNHTYSAPVAINGSGMTYTDETTYRKIKESLEITDSDYINNITVVGQKGDGYAFEWIFENCLNDGAISLALQEKNEVVSSTQFTAHYNKSTMTTVPIKIREYVA